MSTVSVIKYSFRMVRILVIGHSHVATLEKGVRKAVHGWGNFRFPQHDVVFDFVYRGGARVGQVLHGGLEDDAFADEVQRHMDDFRPHVLWLWVGDNDLRVPARGAAEELVLRIFNTAATLVARNCSVQFAAILQLLPRYRGARGNIHFYNTAAAEVNARLLHLCQQTGRHLYFAMANFRFPEDWRQYVNNRRLSTAFPRGTARYNYNRKKIPQQERRQTSETVPVDIYANPQR